LGKPAILQVSYDGKEGNLLRVKNFQLKLQVYYPSSKGETPAVKERAAFLEKGKNQ